MINLLFAVQNDLDILSLSYYSEVKVFYKGFTTFLFKLRNGIGIKITFHIIRNIANRSKEYTIPTRLKKQWSHHICFNVNMLIDSKSTQIYLLLYLSVNNKLKLILISILWLFISLLETDKTSFFLKRAQLAHSSFATSDRLLQSTTSAIQTVSRRSYT